MHHKTTDGLIEYKLGMNYGEHKAGSTIRVDPERRLWLDEHGYGHDEKPKPTAAAGPRKSGTITGSK